MPGVFGQAGPGAVRLGCAGGGLTSPKAAEVVAPRDPRAAPRRGAPAPAPEAPADVAPFWAVPAPVPGFPARFPVRSDARRPWRYRIAAGTCRIALRVLFAGRLRFEGSAGVPMEGALLVAANHISNWDGPIIGAFFPGTLFAMAKREMFRIPLLAWGLAGCNCFPVERGSADRRALRISLDLLSARRRLLIFIEGHRSRGGGMRPAERGVGFLVRRSGAPVLPVAILGTERALRRTGGLLPRRGRLLVRYGRPVTVTGRTDQEIADAVASAVAALLPPSYRGIHGRAGAAGLPATLEPPQRSPGR